MVSYAVLTDRLKKQKKREKETRDYRAYYVNRVILILFCVGAYKIQYFSLKNRIQF